MKPQSQSSAIGPAAKNFLAARKRFCKWTPLTIYSAAVIQELNRKLTKELTRRDAENAELRQSVNELKELMQTMNRRLDGGAK